MPGVHSLARIVAERPPARPAVAGLSPLVGTLDGQGAVGETDDDEYAGPHGGGVLHEEAVAVAKPRLHGAATDHGEPPSPRPRTAWELVCHAE